MCLMKCMHLTTSVTLFCVLSISFLNEKATQKEGEIQGLKRANDHLVSTKIVVESSYLRDEPTFVICTLWLCSV